MAAALQRLWGHCEQPISGNTRGGGEEAGPCAWDAAHGGAFQAGRRGGRACWAHPVCPRKSTLCLVGRVSGAQR
jgi:hypothetical protein